MKIKLAKTELIHFVGIGGIGMSGLALIMKRKGFKVQGSDVSNNKNVERLKKDYPYQIQTDLIRGEFEHIGSFGPLDEARLRRIIDE